MNILYTDDLNSISSKQLKGFFVGWKKKITQEQHFALLKNSTFFVCAINQTSSDIVGFITALSDRVNTAFIPLLEVLPEYQHKGIGKHLMKTMLLKLEDIANIDLTCDQEMQPFYAHFKMMKSHGMVIRKHLKL